MAAVQHQGGGAQRQVQHMYTYSRQYRYDVAGEVGFCLSVIGFMFSYEILLPIKVTIGIVTGFALPLPLAGNIGQEVTLNLQVNYFMHVLKAR